MLQTTCLRRQIHKPWTRLLHIRCGSGTDHSGSFLAPQAPSLVPVQAGTPWTSESDRAPHSQLQDPTQSNVPVQPLLKCTSDSFQNVAPAQAAFTQSIWQPQRVGSIPGIAHPQSTYTLHCGRSRMNNIPQQQATGGSQSGTGREAGISHATLGMCENKNYGSSIGGWTCPPRAWLEGGDP